MNKFWTYVTLDWKFLSTPKLGEKLGEKPPNFFPISCHWLFAMLSRPLTFWVKEPFFRTQHNITYDMSWLLLLLYVHWMHSCSLRVMLRLGFLALHIFSLHPAFCLRPSMSSHTATTTSSRFLFQHFTSQLSPITFHLLFTTPAQTFLFPVSIKPFDLDLCPMKQYIVTSFKVSPSHMSLLTPNVELEWWVNIFGYFVLSLSLLLKRNIYLWKYTFGQTKSNLVKRATLILA